MIVPDIIYILAIGLGMFISIILTESVGVTAGGLIVPGYIAMNLHNPSMVLFTFLISLLTLLLLNIFSNFMIIYGKRRLVFCVLTAFVLGAFIRLALPLLSLLNPHLLTLRQFIFEVFPNIFINLEIGSYVFIGFLIPGLISSWMDRQGIIVTSATILIVSSFISLILMALNYV